MKVALVGNQNSGKTTLFNTLTGMNAKIGNWPGVTIEKKTGKIKNTNYEIIDLPGIYSLSPYSIEEDVSRKFIFDEEPEVIINIIDSTQLERSLYLTTQLLELDSKVIIALNMADVLEKKGIILNADKLEEKLGAKVVKISALKGTGIDELINEINNLQMKRVNSIYDDNLKNAIGEIVCRLPANEKHKKFVAIKLLENDERFQNLQTNEIKFISNKLSKNYDTDLEEIIATERYEYIEKVKKYSVVQKIRKSTLTDKLDKVFLNKWLSIPIFLAIMFLIYYLSVGIIGKCTSDCIYNLIKSLSNNVTKIMIKCNIPKWIVSLLTDGIITGVGNVLSFIPQLMILFICITLLETTGYMSRISLILDRVFRKLGLSGKSLIPFIIGSGCSVPAIIGTRIIENQDEREMTTILVPFIPCSAKLPIISLFSGYFFKESSGIVSASIYFLSILIIIFSALLMKKFVYRNISNTYISELPEYKLPNIKYVLENVYDKTMNFIKRAGSIILISSIIIWFLISFSFQFEYGIDINKSILAEIGKKVSWVFYPMIGENSWEVTVSAMQGIIAKEQVISSMSVINGISESELEQSNMFTAGGTFDFFSKSSAYAFIIFNIFSAPCIGAISAMRRELGKTTKVIKTVTYQTIVAWCIATLFYQICIKIENNTINIFDILVVIAIIFSISILLKKVKVKVECLSCPYCNSCVKK